MGFGIYTRLCRAAHFVKHVNIFSTIYWNFKLFPFKTARLLPVFIGYNVDIKGYTGGGISIQSNFVHRGMIKIGITELPIFPANGVHTMLRFQGGSKIVFGNNISIYKGCSIVASYGSTIEIGDDVVINMDTLIYSNNNIKIGNHVRIGWSSQIYDTSIHLMVETHTGNISTSQHEVLISDNVWLANHVTLAPGAKIPPFTTVAACSLVNKDFLNETTVGGLIVGAPAKFRDLGKIRIWNELIEWHLKNKFINEKRAVMNINEIGLSQTPFDATRNILYTSK